MNIVDMILKLLTGGDTISKIASMLGIGQEQAGKAVTAAVPTLLASLAGAASKPGGGAQLASALAKQDPGVLDNLSGLFSGGGAAAASQGSNLLGSLLGTSGLGQIGSVLSRFTGLGDSVMTKLLGLLTPIMLSVIGKQSKGMDTAGLASMLVGQKANIASALPSGLGSMLSSSIPGIGGILSSVSDTASSAARTATNFAGTAARQVEAKSSSAMRWVVPLVLLGLGIFLVPRMCSKVSDSAQAVKDQATEVVSTAVSDSTKFIKDATGLITSATESVASIKDEASATAAIPKLQEITSKLTGLDTLMAKLPVAAQKSVADALRPLIARLRDAVQPLLAMPVVGDKVKPAVDALLAQVGKLAPAL